MRSASPGRSIGVGGAQVEEDEAVVRAERVLHFDDNPYERKERHNTKKKRVRDDNRKEGTNTKTNPPGVRETVGVPV